MQLEQHLKFHKPTTFAIPVIYASKTYDKIIYLFTNVVSNRQSKVGEN